MSIDDYRRMICDHCGEPIGTVDIMDYVDNLTPTDMTDEDECHRCRSQRLKREVKNEAQEGTGHDARGVGPHADE